MYMVGNDVLDESERHENGSLAKVGSWTGEWSWFEVGRRLWRGKDDGEVEACLPLEQDDTPQEKSIGEGGSRFTNAAPFLSALFVVSFSCSLVYRLFRSSNRRCLVRLEV